MPERNQLLELRKTNLELYKQTAIAAMQGIQEANGKLGLVSDLLPRELARHAFDIADAMLEEYLIRITE